MIRMGARDSKLSKAQFAEFSSEHPHLFLHPVWVATPGDRDKTTSLRTLGKTDFFTKDLDELLLSHQIDAALHSAKDLPDPLPSGIRLVRITRGQDSRDALVYREGELPNAGALIATSSIAREERVGQMISGLSYIDIRGTIEERLQKLYDRAIDGIVIAEAALIRLNLTHLPRLFLPGESTPLQGRLAVTIRENDARLRELLNG